MTARFILTLSWNKAWFDFLFHTLVYILIMLATYIYAIISLKEYVN